MSLRFDSNRDVSLDAIAGLFITIMMFQHFNIVTRAPLTIGHLFMYNTVWFFFKSGMFHKPTTITRQVLTKWGMRLIIPFIMCSLFGGLISMLCEFHMTGNLKLSLLYGIVGQIVVFGAPWWNIPVWFLLTLFFVKLITSCYNGRHTWIYVSVSIIISCLHYTLSDSTRFNYIGNTALATLFYVFGYKSIELKVARGLMYWLLAIVFLTIFIFFPAAIDIWANRPLYGSYILAVFAAFLGILLVNNLFENCKFLQVRLLSFLGQNAMLFLVFHVPFYLAFCTLPVRNWLSPVSLNWCGAGFSIICCFLVYLFFERHKKYKWLIGG